MIYKLKHIPSSNEQCDRQEQSSGYSLISVRLGEINSITAEGNATDCPQVMKSLDYNLSYLTMRNRQQAVGNFILDRKHRHWVQNNAVFVEDILKTPLRIWIFFSLRGGILRHDSNTVLFDAFGLFVKGKY